MAGNVLPEVSNFDTNVYELQLTDPVQGGTGADGQGVANAPLLNLANRTRWLHDQLVALQAAIVALAPINSPIFTGSAEAPTALPGDDSTLLATTAFVDAATDGAVTIPCGGNGNVVLTQAQAGLPILILTGALTGPINVIFPTETGLWLVSNRTTGAFAITCKTAAGGGEAISQGHSRLVFGDGAAIIPMDDYADAVLGGAPTATSPGAGDNSQRVATTAWVQALAATLAPLVSAALQGAPTAPTPAVGDNSQRLATTAFVRTYLATLPPSGDMFRANNLGDVANPATALGNLGGLSIPAAAATYAPLLSAILQGAPEAPTPVASDSSQKIATTAYVKGAVAGLLTSAAAAATYAPILSPTLQGSPQSPTPAGNDNSTRIATTAFVQALTALLAPLNSPVLTGAPTAPTPGVGDASTRIATTAWVAGLIAGLAPLTSPAFTGTPQAPTPGQGDNSARLATTAYVIAALGGYLSTATAAATYAPLASPALQGSPTAPTPPQGDNSGRLATTAFIQALLGGGQVFGNPGACRLPNGWIIQAGYVAGPFSEQNVGVTYPVAFPNACISALATVRNSAANISVATRVDTQSAGAGQAIFFVNRDSSSSPNIEGFQWIALGY